MRFILPKTHCLSASSTSRPLGLTLLLTTCLLTMLVMCQASVLETHATADVSEEFNSRMRRRLQEQSPPVAVEEEDDDDDDDEVAATPPLDPKEAQQRVVAGRIRNTINRVNECFHSRNRPRTAPRKHKDPTLIPHKSVDPLIEFGNAIDDTDLEHLFGLVKCVREILPDHFEDRPFDLGASKYGGGNNVTYIGGFFEAVLPELTSRILDVATAAASHAGWYPHPRHLGFRCVELLEYYTGGELLMHVDSDSIYTMVLMLADPSDFTGGRFEIKYRPWPSSVQLDKADALKIQKITPAVASPDRLGGILFDSNADHGVTPILTGKRTVLAIELWAFEDVDIEGLRPDIKYAGALKRPNLVSVKTHALGFMDSFDAGDGDGKPDPAAAAAGAHQKSAVWSLGAIARGLGAAAGPVAALGNGRDFSLGIVVGMSGTFLFVFLFFRDASPLPSSMMPEKDKRKGE